MIDVGHEQAAGDEMKHEDMDRNAATGRDEFWGGTPDWSNTPQRPRRTKRSGDVTGAIKGLWASAMSAGADGTREHRVLDATAPLPADEFEVGPQMFDDLDDDSSDRFSPSDSFHRDVPHAIPSERAVRNTRDLPVIDVFRDEHFDDDRFDDDRFDDDAVAAMTPVSVSEREARTRRSSAIDPLLVRVGAVALATTLLVPLAMGLSSGGDDTGDTLASATTQVAATTETLDTTPIADVADTAAEVTTTPAVLDPESLPRAVPVNGDSTTSSTTDASAESDAADELATESSDSDSATASVGVDAMQIESANTDDADIDEAASPGDGAERVTNCATEYTVVAGDFWLRLADA
ncbi:MAG: hypothetical protein ABJ314_02220, partial [Ilumatobacter sp.]